MAAQGNPPLTLEKRFKLSILLPAGQERHPGEETLPINRDPLAGGELPRALRDPIGAPRDPEEARTRRPHAWTLA